MLSVFYVTRQQGEISQTAALAAASFHSVYLSILPAQSTLLLRSARERLSPPWNGGDVLEQSMGPGGAKDHW